LSDLNKLQKTEGSTFADIAAAQLNRLDADAKLIEAVAEVERARVRLRERTGELVIECAGTGGAYCPPTSDSFAPPPLPSVESIDIPDPAETINPLNVAVPIEADGPAPSVTAVDFKTEEAVPADVKFVVPQTSNTASDVISRRILYGEGMWR
jgi:hypothetical protein